jgi:hypothetical protein
MQLIHVCGLATDPIEKLVLAKWPGKMKLLVPAARSELLDDDRQPPDAHTHTLDVIWKREFSAVECCSVFQFSC